MLGKKEKTNELQTDQEERCILCGKQTGIRKNIPITERKYYVDTAGQLCASCYAQVYMPIHNDDILER